MKRTLAVIVLAACLFGWVHVSDVSSRLMSAINPQPVYEMENRPLDGQPDYPVNADKRIDYWVVNCKISDATTTEVDRILEDLNADHIAQTIILCINQTVANPTAYAERFLRYMELGLPEGERRNNGFAFVVFQDRDKIDVHYGVGTGLSALVSDLAEINRAGEDIYSATKNLDEAVLGIANSFNVYARSKYAPLNPVAPAYGGPIDRQTTQRVLLFGGILLFFWVLLLTETIFSILTIVLGSDQIFNWLLWPLYLLGWILQIAAAVAESSGSSGGSYSSSGYHSSSSSSSSGSSSAGHSGSGGGHSNRGN